jgi:hypothetical protein
MDKQSISMLNIFAIATLTAFIAILFTVAAITADAQVPGVTPQQDSTESNRHHKRSSKTQLVVMVKQTLLQFKRPQNQQQIHCQVIQHISW